MHICLSACINAPMHPCMHSCKHAYMHACVYVCMWACLDVCTCARVPACMHGGTHMQACMQVWHTARVLLNNTCLVYVACLEFIQDVHAICCHQSILITIHTLTSLIYCDQWELARNIIDSTASHKIIIWKVRNATSNVHNFVFPRSIFHKLIKTHATHCLYIWNNKTCFIKQPKQQ